MLLFMCRTRFMTLGRLKPECIISKVHAIKTKNKHLFLLYSLHIHVFLPDRSNIIYGNSKYKPAEYISDYFTGFCLCFSTPQLTDSYDFQMGEQERAGERQGERRINWIQKISITLMNAPC